VSYRSKFVVEPGKRVRLDDVDPGWTGKHVNEDDARAAIGRDVERLEKLQYRLYAENRRSLLIVLQAPDAGGKDGTVRHVFRAFNPQGASVHGFKVPTAEEAAHDFLWRVHAVAPARGRIAIFNRSHYEDVLVPRVHATLPKETLEKRYDRINEFEKNLVQAGTHIVKFFLHISEAEQLKRLEARLEDPQRRWKLNPEDFAEHRRWDDYRRAYDRMLKRTSTHRAPWFVIPANHKWFRNLAVARIVLETLDDLGMDFPKPAVDVDELRRSYYIAAQDARRR
jgi:PPK2 family polyphosphate:nucleotide phosphotransferase